MQQTRNQKKSKAPRRARSTKLWPLAGAAAVLGGLAVANTLRARKAERDNPPIGQFAKVNGVCLHYVEKGSGPPILLVHGNGVMVQDWIISGLFDELAKTNRVIAVDRPGFGHSSRPRGTRWTPEKQADLMAGLLEQLDAVPALAVGHSYGTQLVTAMALNHPEKLSGVVLLGGLFYPDPRADVLLVAGSAMPVYGDVLNHTLQPLLAEALQKPVNRTMFGPAPTPDRWRREFSWAMAMRPSRMRAGAADAVHMVPAARRLSPRFGEIKLPVAIVAGSGDRIVSPTRQSERLHRDLPHSRLRLVAGAGHMVHHSGFEAVAAAVRRV
jgi:pimeloyl-ACP methyl ester carboxylesterase